MPILKTVKAWGSWGDLLYIEDIGRIYSIDALGRIGLCFGPPKRYDTNVPAGRNDDGSKNRCAATAFQHLGLSRTRLDNFRKNAADPDNVPAPTELISKLLASYEKLLWSGTVGDFIKQHPTGNFYASFYNDYTETRSHAFALVNGTAMNITYASLACEVIAAWRIDTGRDEKPS